MFKISKKLLFSSPLLAMATIGLFSVSSPVRAETMGQAVEAALNFHPSVEAAIANRDAMLEEKKEKFSDFFPHLGVNVTGGRMYGDNSTSRGLSVTRGVAYSWLWEGSATLSQTIFNGFETTNRVDAAQARRISANHNIVDVRENLALQTVVTYLSVLRGRESLAMLRSQSDKIVGYISRIESMVAEGAADNTMAMQAHDISVQLEDTIARLDGELHEAIAQYIEFTGHAPESGMNRPGMADSLLPEGLDDAIIYAKRNHPSVKVAVMDEKALAYDRDAESGFIYPDFTGEVSYMQKDQKEEIGGEVVDARATVRMNWEISFGGGDFARVKKAKERQFEGRAQRENTLRQIERQIRVSWFDAIASKKQLGYARKRVYLNEKIFETNKSQFEGARINLLQLMQSDNALFNSRIAQLNGEFRYMAAQYSALTNMGRLQETLNVVPNTDHDG